MEAFVIPNLEVVTPKTCIECRAVLLKIRTGVGQLACSSLEEAAEIESQWAEHIAQCEMGPAEVGQCGERLVVCRHPAGVVAVKDWQPESY